MTGETAQAWRAALLTTAEMRQADELTIAGGTDSLVLMEQAGAAIARVLSDARAPGKLVVLAGPGNNGGDGFVAARLAQEAGWRVTVGLLGDAAKLSPDAAAMAKRWTGDTVPATPDLLNGADAVIDALFGAGLTRPISGEAAALVNAVNGSGAHVIAADIPSGIDGDTGAIKGAAIRAHDTVTFFRAKPGHCLLPGRTFCGRIHVADIGIPQTVLDDICPRFCHNTPALWLPDFPSPDIATHKHRRGHTMVVSGGPLNTGAARLAAQGALRAGSGLVTVLAVHDAAMINAMHLTAIMVRAYEDMEELAEIARARALALVIGPAAGISERTKANVLALLSLDLPIVLDADALTVFQNRPRLLFDALHEKAVLTPHVGEFERLFPGLLKTAASRADAARQAAKRICATVLLKGPDTVIAGPRGASIAISTNATPDLATAGSGDVLCGIIAGLMAQGMTSFKAACAGVWLHGDAGARFGRGLTAEDLPELLPESLKSLDALGPV